MEDIPNGVQHTTPCKTLDKLFVMWDEHKEHHSKFEAKFEEHDKVINEMKEFQAGTKIFVGEIKEQLVNLDKKYFAFMAEMIKKLTEKDETETKVAAKERSSSQKEWVSLIKYVLGGTIIAIVAYLFGKG